MLLLGNWFAALVGAQAWRRIGALCARLRGLGLEAPVGEKNADGRDVLGHGAVVGPSSSPHASPEDSRSCPGGGSSDVHGSVGCVKAVESGVGNLDKSSSTMKKTVQLKKSSR